jgi:hypothetical protein
MICRDCKKEKKLHERSRCYKEYNRQKAKRFNDKHGTHLLELICRECGIKYNSKSRHLFIFCLINNKEL